MDNDIRGFLQDVGNGSKVDQAMEDCLRNPVILTKMLQNFSTAELMKLSVVNKLWKSEARNVMRKRGQFTAYVKAHDLDEYYPHRVADTFISDLKRMSPVPYSGISFDFDFNPLLASWPIAAVDTLQGVVLDQPAFLKTLSVQFRGSWMKNLASPRFLLAKKALQDCSRVLEELEFYIESEREHFVQEVFQDVTFPKLKVLKLRDDYYRRRETVYENYTKAIMSRAPNIKVLHISWSINLMLRVLEGTPVVPVYGSRVDTYFHEISEDVISRIKLERMTLICTGFEFDFERFNRITPMLLRTSCTTTLHYVEVEAVLAVPLMCYGVRLENVKTLWMNINYNHLETIEPRILGIVKNFDFTRIFPNLTTVSITGLKFFSECSPNHMNRIIDQAHAVLRDPMPDRAVNIKMLVLNQRNLSSLAVQFFAEMFPSIEKLNIKTAEIVPFESVWKNWLDIKVLKVRGKLWQSVENLDSVFCGIFPEEVAQLREKDEEYLKRVNIVPVKPAVTCLKSLRVLYLSHNDPVYVRTNVDATSVLSKVTALVAFLRSPTLTVTLNNPPNSSYEVRQAINDLKPHLSVITYHYKGGDWEFYSS